MPVWGWFILYWIVAIPAGILLGKWLKGQEDGNS